MKSWWKVCQSSKTNFKKYTNWGRDENLMKSYSKLKNEFWKIHKLGSWCNLLTFYACLVLTTSKVFFEAAQWQSRVDWTKKSFFWMKPNLQEQWKVVEKSFWAKFAGTMKSFWETFLRQIFRNNQQQTINACLCRRVSDLYWRLISSSDSLVMWTLLPIPTPSSKKFRNLWGVKMPKDILTL